MSNEFDLTESDNLGYYTTFDELFPKHASFLNNKEINRNIEVNFLFTDDDTQPLETQIRANEFLKSNCDEMLDSLFSYLKQDEEYFMEYYGVYRETSYNYVGIKGKTHTRTNKYGFPCVDEIHDFVNYIEIDSIYISDSTEDNFPFVGFGGKCPWDEEHGFGASFHKQNLLHVGDWNYGFHPSWAKRDKKDLLTNYFTGIRKLEDLSKRRNRIAKQSQLIEVTNPDEYVEIFDWLADKQAIYGYRNTDVDLSPMEKIVILNEISKLSFNGQEMDTIPSSLSLLKNLTFLSLSFNKLKVIPSQVFQLTKLENLSITYNQVKEVPEDIKLLHNLKHLNLYSNQLENLPESIAELNELDMLNIGSNKFRKISEILINLLSRLKTIHIYDNLFSIHDLEHIKTLDKRNVIIDIDQEILQIQVRQEWQQKEDEAKSIDKNTKIKKEETDEIKEDINTQNKTNNSKANFSKKEIKRWWMFWK